MMRGAFWFRVLVLIALSVFGIDALAQIDMERQLRERAEHHDTYDDSDRDRHGKFNTFYLSPRTGDINNAWADTLMLNYYHRAFVEGLNVAEAYTGTQASPYQSKIYFDRPLNRWGAFYFTNPYNHLIRRGKRMQWYDTKVPYTFLKYLTVGAGENKEQNFTFDFSTNLGKRWSLGGDVDIDYANGYYASTNSNNITYRVFSYYRGNRYQAYASIGNTNTVNQESGGVTDMKYITNPDEFNEGRRTLQPKDIPTKYKSTWNRVIYGVGRLYHKYSLGFYRELDSEGNIIQPKPKPESQAQPELEAPKDSIAPILPELEAPSDTIPAMEPTSVPSIRKRTGKSSGQADAPKEGEEEEEQRDNRIFIPVTSFFHDFQLEQGSRRWLSLDPAFEKEYPKPIIPKPTGGRYFPNDYFHVLKISNTLGVELMEGFHKWAKMGIAVFVSYDIVRYTQPLMDEEDALRLKVDKIETLKATENTVYVGGRIGSKSFKYFDYYVWGQLGVAGAQAGEIEVKGELNTHIPLMKKEVGLSATVDLLNTRPSYFLRHYKASLHEWNQDLAMIQMLRIGGVLDIPFTKTRVHVGVETLQNPMFANKKGEPIQERTNTRVLALGLDQKFSWRFINWENSIVWQKSSNQSIIPLPDLSVYSNFYLRFLIAKVMTLQLGADAKWHTAYHAPYYEPSTQLFRAQSDVMIGGGIPLVNAYANLHLKRTKFFFKYYNIGALIAKPNNFSMPMYPTYPPVLRMGVAIDLRN